MMTKRKLYDEEQMQRAVSAVRQKKMKLRVAAQEFKVPKSTLSDKLKGRYKGMKPGPRTELTDEEEKGLVNFLLYMANQGFPLTRSMTRCFIIDIIKQSGRATAFNMEKGPSDGWFQRFTSRHPELSSRKPENLDKGRLSMSTAKVVGYYFEFLAGILNKYGIKNKPSQIFNCDETGFTEKEMPRAKVFGPKGKHVFRQKTSSSDHITPHLCVSADGKILPSMIIFQGSLSHRKYNDGVPDTWFFSHSDSGYMDRELFQKWFSSVFIPHCGRERLVLLIMDNHDAHISISLIEEAMANDVVLVGLPRHTTHILQPLDVKIIGPLKERYAAVAASLGQTSSLMVIGKARFPLVLKHALDKATPAPISEAFAVTGICPFNPDAVDKSQLVAASFDNDKQRTADNDKDVITTCTTCGSYSRNPLVVHGLIPQALSSILMPPPVKPQLQKKNRRLVTEARLISGAEMLQPLKEKKEHENKKRQAVERRKIEVKEKRELKTKMEQEKRAKREQEKEERAKRREQQEEEKRQRKIAKEEQKLKRNREKEEKRKQKANSTVNLAKQLAARLYVCDVCRISGEADDEERGIMWYGCDEDSCQRWYHNDCLSRVELEWVHESLGDGTSWYCKVCKPWLYHEE